MQLLIKSVRSVLDVKNYSRKTKFSLWAVIWKCVFPLIWKTQYLKNAKPNGSLICLSAEFWIAGLWLYFFHYLHNLVFVEIVIMLVAEPPNLKEAVTWLYRASIAGHVRSQYQLALCLHQGRGVNCNIKDAVCYSSLTHFILNLWVNFFGEEMLWYWFNFPHFPILDYWLLIVH